MYRVELRVTTRQWFVDGQEISFNENMRRAIYQMPVETRVTVRLSCYFVGKNKDDAFEQAHAYCRSDYYNRKFQEWSRNRNTGIDATIERVSKGIAGR